jgi:hypothetical protein
MKETTELPGSTPAEEAKMDQALSTLAEEVNPAARAKAARGMCHCVAKVLATTDCFWSGLGIQVRIPLLTG